MDILTSRFFTVRCELGARAESELDVLYTSGSYASQSTRTKPRGLEGYEENVEMGK
jgi:hypothetical protein